MLRRVMLWGSIGLGLGLAWAIYAALVPMYVGSITPLTSAVLAITCPIAYASLAMHFPLQLAWAFVINTATFAAIGAALESVRAQLAH